MDKKPIQTQSLTSIADVDAFQREEIAKTEANRAASASRSYAFERRKRLPYLIQKGLAKPGRISFDTLRRAVASVHVARICVNVLKEKVTKTKWAIQPIDPLAKVDPKRIKEVENFFRYPNQTGETFRSFLDKSLEDLLVLDSVAWEKTRFPDGRLAELHYIDAATIRPVFDDHGNQDVLIPLKNIEDEVHEVPVSYVQVVDSNTYGGPESGDLIAAWPRKDFIYFHMHPQGSMNNFGYGLSPIESVIGVVANILSADNFNASYFEEGSFPPILLHIMDSIDQRELESMREYLYNELDGRFHRPAIVAGPGKLEVSNLKDISQRDMQFMQYMEFMSRLLAAAYGLSGQDIGLTDDLNRATSEVQKDLSEAKGYGSVLSLIKEILNQEVIWKDFGYDDIEFEWVSPDSLDPEVASRIHDTALRNGTMTINEVRKQMGESPYDSWADTPAVLSGDEYRPIVGPQQKKEESDPADEVGGERPFKQQANEEISKAVYTTDGVYRCWADDRGVGQPFIFVDILKQTGYALKPPVAVNLESQQLEEEWTQKLAEEGLNVNPVVRMSEVDIIKKILPNAEVIDQFRKYQNMTEEYDSEKWRNKYGGSRKFPYYSVSKFISGRSLKDPLLVDDMKRVPWEYRKAIEDLARLWVAEKKHVLGDRRADQVMITPDKRAVGFDYQFVGNKNRWEGTKDAYFKSLAAIPELQSYFKQLIENEEEKERLGKMNKSFVGIILNKLKGRQDI